LLILLSVLPHAAAAHGIRLTAVVEGEAIVGQARYVADGPVAQTRVTVYAPSGKRLGATQTDDEGRFRFVPTVAQDHRFWLDSGDGHAAECVVEAAELPIGVRTSAANSPVATSADELAATIDRVVSERIKPLHEEVLQLRHALRLRDILGGIGYILGVTGLWFLLKARSARRA
jgi:nickel transport protein